MLKALVLYEDDRGDPQWISRLINLLPPEELECHCRPSWHMSISPTDEEGRCYNCDCIRKPYIGEDT